MRRERIQGDERGAYVVLETFLDDAHGIAYGTRVLGGRRASTRGSDVLPGGTGEPCTGGSGPGDRMAGDCEVRVMRIAAAGLTIVRACLGSRSLES